MVLETAQGCKGVTFLSLCTLASLPATHPTLGRTQGAVCALTEAGKAWIPPAEERAVFGDVSRHFRPGAPVRKWHYDKGRYTQGRTSRPQSPATRVFFKMSAACTFSIKSIIQVHIELKSWLVSRHSAVLAKIISVLKGGVKWHV